MDVEEVEDERRFAVVAVLSVVAGVVLLAAGVAVVVCYALGTGCSP